MAQNNMTVDQIIDALNEIGETGQAKLRGTELHVQREENGQWWFLGTVADVGEAQQAIDEYFA